MKNKARILVFTGDGKGKTTAAMGMALRAAGHGMRVLVVQFVKKDTSTGEIEAFKKFDNVKFLQTGCGFVPAVDSSKFRKHKEKAEEGFRFCREAVLSGEYDLVVMDELCTAIAKLLIDEQDVVDLLANAPDNLAIAMTGRGATPVIKSLADTVTEMCCIKHGFDKGVKAQKGVEF